MLRQAWAPETTTLMNARGGPTGQGLDSTQQPAPVSPPAVVDRHIMTQTDFAGSQFLDNDGGHSCRNVGIFSINLFNTDDNARTFHLMSGTVISVQFSYHTVCFTRHATRVMSGVKGNKFSFRNTNKRVTALR
jgi:hypothetical protein